jgi:hypothetical protein
VYAIALAKVSPTGSAITDQYWRHPNQNILFNGGTSMTTSSSNGNLYMVTSFNLSNGGNRQNVSVVMRLNPATLAPIWAYNYQTTTNSDEGLQPTALTADSSGNLYVAFYNNTTGQNNNVICKFDSNGNVITAKGYTKSGLNAQQRSYPDSAGERIRLHSWQQHSVP